MTEKLSPSRAARRRTVLFGGAALAIGLGAVYGIRGPGGNSPADDRCRGARALAGAVEPFARGEVAGFVPARSPVAASDLGFVDETGTARTIADFAGRTVLLNLWATWCAPCRHEMPALDRLQARLGNEDFTVVAVNIDTGDPAAPKRFLADIGATSLDYYADPTMEIFNTLKRRGRAIGMPTTLLLDPQGCEIGTMAGPAEWDSGDALALIRAAVAGA